MKKLLFVLVSLCMLVAVNGQQGDNESLLSGEVIYEEIIKMDIQLEGVDAEIAAQIPKERRMEKVLHFNEEEALLENLQKENPEENIPSEGSGMVIKMYEPDNKTYLDLKNKKIIEQQEFMSRIFLIESDLEPEKWKMTGKQKQILDYACQEAITIVEGKKVQAWFTPQIAVGAGPGRYSSLPGLVLAMEMDNGDRTLTAVKVELKPLDKGTIKKPSKGKNVTSEEYKAIVDEKLKEMGVEENEGGSGQAHSVVIKIQQ